MTQKTVEILIGPDEEGLRLDVVLGKASDLPCRSACVKLINTGAVLLNGVAVTSKKEKLKLGDRLLITFDVEDEEEALVTIMPNPIPLDVRYEDDELIVLSKQKGLVCHPAPGHKDDTLCNALVARYGYENLGHIQGDLRPGIVHRLDMDTTGLMLAAKTDATQLELQDLIRIRAVDRRYITLVHGIINSDEGVIAAPIARSRKNRLMMAVSDLAGSRGAYTTYRVLARIAPTPGNEGYTLVECHLYTGRTHQIRVHMRHIGHPCVGDPLYGRGSEKMNFNLDRQFLHSWHIKFEHPVTSDAVEVFDTLAPDLLEVINPLADSMLDVTAVGQKILPLLDIEGFKQEG